TFLEAQKLAESQDNYAALAVGNFRGNGYSGVAVLTPTSTPSGFAAVYVLQGAGQSLFPPPVQLPGNGTGVAFGDFTGDGKMDVAFGGGAGTQQENIQVVPGYGDGTFSSPINNFFSEGATQASLVAGDFNGDGKLDLLRTLASKLGSFKIFPGN